MTLVRSRRNKVNAWGESPVFLATRWRVSNDILSQSQPPTLAGPVVRRTSGPVGRQGRSSAAQAKLSCGAAGGALDHGHDYCCKQPRPHRQYAPGDRKSVVTGKSVSVRVDCGGRRIIKKKKKKNT